jgi:hypothetical protein
MIHLFPFVLKLIVRGRTGLLENQENRQETFLEKSGIVKFVLMLPFMVKFI